MRLFHSFPRPRKHGQRGDQAGARTQDASAELILRSIVRRGFLCTPERLAIHPHPATQNPGKRALIANGKPEYTHIQSRMCFTLCEERELFQRVARGYTPSSADSQPASLAAHTDLFGPFSLAIDVPAARQIGILPATYYSPVDAHGQRYNALGGRPGLHLQIIQKLKELRDLSVVLALVERSLVVQGAQLPTDDMLEALGIDLPYQPEIVERAYRLSLAERRRVFELFNTDRESALSLVGFIDMMFSLFQETDSYFPDGTPLAFYQQREWRLIHHMRQGARWYCLGPQPAFRNPLAQDKREAISELRQAVDDLGGVPRGDEYFSNCWVLEEIDGRPLREFISCCIVPARCVVTTTKTLRAFRCDADVVPAEEFGYVGT